jgi:tetratricopeptide (TPR) repeat protein
MYRFMKTTILSVVLSLAIMGCTSREMPVAEKPFTIPELKARPVSLSPGEFKVYSTKYAELREKISNDPTKTAAYVEMAQLFMNEARITGDHPYYYPAAKILLDKALSLEPNDFGALISLGSIQLSLHKFPEAAEIGKRAAAIAPHSNYPWGIICDASLELGDYATAVIAADSMVAIRPDLRSYARVSYLREIHGDLDGAIAAMDMAVKAGVPGREEKAWARYALGNLHLSRGDVRSAEKEFLVALNERPNYAFALAGLAKIHTMKHEYDAAIALLDSASGLVPEFSFAQMKADIYNVMGNHAEEQKLISEIEEMLAEDEASGHAMDREFAMLYATRGIKSDKAETYARKEYTKRPNNTDAQLSLAIALMRSNKLAEASELLSTAKKLSGKNPSTELQAYASLVESKKGNTVSLDVLRSILKQGSYLNPVLRKEIEQTIKING